MLFPTEYHNEAVTGTHFNISKCNEALLASASGHQRSYKAHQAGNQDEMRWNTPELLHFFLLIYSIMFPGRFQCTCRYVIFKLIDCWDISCEIALRWLSLDFTDGKSTWVRVMAWCRQAASHYLSQSWPCSMLPYDITNPQCVNSVFILNISGQIWIQA